MKFLFVLVSIIPLSLFAQTWTKSIPDYFGQEASTSHHYVENEGQVINTDDNSEPSIKAECRGGYAD